MDTAGDNDIFVLLTGDGAGNLNSVGFLSDIGRIHKMGHSFEVISWESGCNRYLKEFAKKNGKFISLEGFYEYVTFIKDRRHAKKLPSDYLGI